MKRLLPVLMGFVFLLLSSTEGWNAEPDKGHCLTGTMHSHAAVMGKCSDAYESKNYGTALREWETLAKDGNSSAQYNLGQMYRKGQGVSQNQKIAVRWFRLAAKQGDAYAQNKLGNMYSQGKDVIQDYVYTHMWWNIAASQGDMHATEFRDNIAKKMTPSQIEKAQDLARECVKKNYRGCGEKHLHSLITKDWISRYEEGRPLGNL